MNTFRDKHFKNKLDPKQLIMNVLEVMKSKINKERS